MCHTHYLFNPFLTVPPLFVIEYLHRAVDVFTEYFGECTERTIKDQYVIVYEVTEIVAKTINYINCTLIIVCGCGFFIQIIY